MVLGTQRLTRISIITCLKKKGEKSCGFSKVSQIFANLERFALSLNFIIFLEQWSCTAKQLAD